MSTDSSGPTSKKEIFLGVGGASEDKRVRGVLKDTYAGSVAAGVHEMKMLPSSGESAGVFKVSPITDGRTQAKRMLGFL
jgi:hypothetical protein